jgi:simple sugar transport system ATP-binding protein
MRGIVMRFGETLALDGVDLELAPGEIHALLGENGAGKSTLMHVLAGLYRPEAGTVELDGRPVRLRSARDAAAAGIGMVHQHFTLVENFTVAENLALALPQTRFFLPRRELGSGALAVADGLGWRLDPRAPVWQLPVGTQQRIEIVKVLALDPRILIFDEPTAVLAPAEVDELFGVLERLRADGRSIVFISHKLNEVLRLCDRITVLRRGRNAGTVPASQTDARDLARRMVGDAEAPEVMEQEASGPQPRSAPGDPVLTLEGVRVRDHRGVEAVRGVSLEVRGGEILGIAGVDGNGQTELAEAILRLRPLSGGSMRFTPDEAGERREPIRRTNDEPAVDGRRGPEHLNTRTPEYPDSQRSTLNRLPPGRLPPVRGWGAQRSHTGFIPQDRRRTGLVAGMSVRDNLILELVEAPEAARGPWLRWPYLNEQAAVMMRDYDVRAAGPDQPVDTLSGGNQQKIVVARALHKAPRLLVAVNPTRGVDIGATAFVYEQLRAQRERGAAILLISTELDEVLALSDRVGVLYEGELMGIVPPHTPRDVLGLMMGGRRADDARTA